MHKKSIQKHSPDLTYFDINGEVLHPVTLVHEMKVISIGPSQQADSVGQVFERLRIDIVYSKRWIEASSVFQTIMLE